MEKKLKLDTFDKVCALVEIASKMDYDIELQSGKYAVNAKSCVGIFALDLTKPVTLVAHSDHCAPLLKEIQPFVVE